jgi:hypothetical protein
MATAVCGGKAMSLIVEVAVFIIVVYVWLKEI